MTTLFDQVFSGQAGVAKQLIDKFGTSATLRRKTKTFDPATGTNTTSTTDYSIKVTPPLAGVEKVGAYRRDVIQNTTVPINEITVTFASSGLAIEPNPTTDFLIFRGATYQIVRVLPVISGDEIAAWQVQAKQ